jgi:hypothetical protein
MIATAGAGAGVFGVSRLREVIAELPPQAVQTELRKTLITLVVRGFPPEDAIIALGNIAIVEQTMKDKYVEALKRNDPGKPTCQGHRADHRRRTQSAKGNRGEIGNGCQAVHRNGYRRRPRRLPIKA